MNLYHLVNEFALHFYAMSDPHSTSENSAYRASFHSFADIPRFCWIWSRKVAEISRSLCSCKSLPFTIGAILGCTGGCGIPCCPRNVWALEDHFWMDGTGQKGGKLRRLWGGFGAFRSFQKKSFATLLFFRRQWVGTFSKTVEGIQRNNLFIWSNLVLYTRVGHRQEKTGEPVRV